MSEVSAGAGPVARRAAEAAAMDRACELAARGRASALPNPVVGCVILDADGRVVGEGWHERPGGPHAEVMALAAAGELARGATAVVTLEPCAHTGRTGPCTSALIRAGIARVVIGAVDPDPVAAGGAHTLRAAGVEVAEVPWPQAEEVNRPWLVAVRRGRPYVTWKFAATLDGRSAAADGTSRWITGEQSRADVHRLRSECDAVIAGVGTVLADDPLLTARPAHRHPPDRQPLRVVVDSRGRTPAHARVRDRSAASTWIATAAEVGADPQGRVDLVRLMTALYARGSRHALLEGGPTLAGAFVQAGLVDDVVAYLAPALLGQGPTALVGGGVLTIAQAHRLRLVDVARFGDDVRLTCRLPTV